MKSISPVHAPGWTHETRAGRWYQVSAPREDRPQQAACWQDEVGDDGDFRRGDTLADVLAIFPPAVRTLFRQVAS